MLITALLVCATLIGSLIMEMAMGSLAYLELAILVALAILGTYAFVAQAERKTRAWSLLIAFHTLSIANATLLFFTSGLYILFILLLAINLAGLLRALAREQDTRTAMQRPAQPAKEAPAVQYKAKAQAPPTKTVYTSGMGHVLPKTQIVDIPGESPKIIPYDDSEIRQYKDSTDSVETYDTTPIPIIEPDALYSQRLYNNTENGAVQRGKDKENELVVRLPRPQKKARKAKAAQKKKATSIKVIRAKKAAGKTSAAKAKKSGTKKAPKVTVLKATKEVAPQEKVVKIIHVSSKPKPGKRKPAKAKNAKKQKKTAQISVRRAKIAPTVRVIRKPTTAVKIAKQEADEPIAAEPGRRRLILDL